MSPAISRPPEAGTTATPYGFTSPLAGTVEATWVRPCSSPRTAAGMAGRAELEVDVVDEQAAAARPRLIMAVRILAWWPGFTVLPLSKVSAPSASADIPVLGQTPLPAPWSRPNKRAGPRRGSPSSRPGSRGGSSNSGHWSRLGHWQRAGHSSPDQEAAFDQGRDLGELAFGHRPEPFDRGRVVRRCG